PCSPPSRTLRAAQARWPSAILDRGCARTPWGRQAGTKKRPSSAEPRNIPGGVSPLLRQGLGSLNPCQTARRRIYDNSTETLLTSATVPSGTAGTLIGPFRYVSIASY